MRFPRPARCAISRVVAAPHPRSAKSVSAASRMRWRADAREASRARAAAVVWLTRVYRSVHGALCVAPASCQAKSVNATRQPGASDPGPVALGIAGAQDLHPGADEAARTV